ncbi:MAG TPA: slipin family protein [Clostridia bacterium]|nr:slipin family protein [Clostridia bacterium]
MGFIFDFFTNFIVIIIIVGLITSAIKIVREYERLVVFRLGHHIGSKGPGIVLIIPFVDTAVRVSLRIVTLDVPSQEVITCDNVTTKVNAVVYYKVVDPSLSILAVERFHNATTELSQTTLRSVVGQAELDQVLSERDSLNQKIQGILDEATDNWGIKVTAVEIKDVTIPPGLLKSIARQAEAERQRRALVIQAEGERQASEKLLEAANILGEGKGGLTLRMLRLLPEVASKEGNVVVFPLPIELATLFTQKSRE